MVISRKAIRRCELSFRWWLLQQMTSQRSQVNAEAAPFSSASRTEKPAARKHQPVIWVRMALLKQRIAWLKRCQLLLYKVVELLEHHIQRGCARYLEIQYQQRRRYRRYQAMAEE